MNKTDQPQHYRIDVSARDLPTLRLREAPEVDVAAGSVASLPLTLVAPAGTGGRHDVRISVRSRDGATERNVDSSFFGPM